MAPESRDEVRQRIASLYDQAENDTGNFNATRAMAARTRSRGVPLSKRAGRRPDPGLDEIARQWFDTARAKLGPTVPAALPADRLPDVSLTPGRPRDRVGGLPGGEREARALTAGGEALALPGGERQALPSAQQPEPLDRGARAVAELTAGSPSELASRPVPALESGEMTLPGGSDLELPGHAVELPGTATTVTAEPGGWGAPGAASPAVLPATAGAAAPGSTVQAPQTAPVQMPMETLAQVPAGTPAQVPMGAPAQLPTGTPVQLPRMLPGTAVPGRPSPTAAKSGARWKLGRARDLLSLRSGWTSQPGTALQTASAAGAQEVQQSAMAEATGQWEQPQWAAPGLPATATPAAGTQAAAVTAPLTDTGSLTSPTDTGSLTALTSTGSFAIPTTATAPAPAPAPDTGSLPLPLPLPLPTPAPESPRSLRAAKAIAFARAQIGKPCVWGAMGPGSYDCSSLTQAAWRAAGVTLPRAAHEQALAGTPVTLAGIEPGDLVLFFDDDRHVGLHVGDGMMVHAPGPGSSIREESIYGAGEAAIHRIVRPA
ncbi:C40 family peptidase [Streptomyces cyanogenus]|uniref:Endopeptidase n=1 Tax=Streptomyces cyanogenus TaxID=80860 RepID=A0ABX7U153_STRCY|nr:C40 family peptidase [Streptomyces cyanogenus]QTE02755.1 putative endopeptidase precursor [Streptomyces cyanogenus]